MSNPIPDATLLLAPGCAHCPIVLAGLSDLVKSGELGRLEIINVIAHPEAAQQAGTRSVPWCRIGPFELDGVQSPAQLAQWVTHAANGSGMDAYYGHLLETQRPHRVAAAIAQTPASLADLLGLLEDDQIPMTVRIGIGVVLEDLRDNPVLRHGLSSLQRLAASSAANIRADAAHYLGLIDTPESRRLLHTLLGDTHPDVREIAAESLQHFNAPE